MERRRLLEDLPQRILGSTRVLAVIGDPIEHSFSPPMHNRVIQHLGLDLVYVAFRVKPEAISSAIAGMRALQILGMNVTVPHKQAVIPYLDEVSEEARIVGAVNTIHNREGVLVGYNTDIYGIQSALRYTAQLDPLPSVVALLGASGAGRGILYAIATQPEVQEIRLFNRTLAKAEDLAREMEEVTGKRILPLPLEASSLKTYLPGCGLLINATSVGMYPKVDESPVPNPQLLDPEMVVYDAVFNPLESRLVKMARARGCAAYGGLDMLVYQGAKAFEIWTGVFPSVEIMRSAVLEVATLRGNLF